MELAPQDVKGKLDFAIITILEDEFGAVLERFPKVALVKGRRHYNINWLPLPSGRFYSVAVTRCVAQGTGVAQSTADAIIDDLDPQWLLVVGIAGGVPAREFTLGDVVVSTHVHDFRVEAVMRGQPSEFSLTGGPMHVAATRVIANLKAMETEMKGWNSPPSVPVPPPLPDFLNKSLYYGEADWQEKVIKSLTRHFAGSTAPRPPLFASGQIASSDRLIKDDILLARWLKTTRHLLAIEMETAGVYLAAREHDPEIPIVTIRGISDIIGFKRDDDWLRYACHSAAAFTRAWLRTEPIPARMTLPAYQHPTKQEMTAAPSTSLDDRGIQLEVPTSLPINNLPRRTWTHFVGRDLDLRELHTYISGASDDGKTVGQVSLYGLPGTGKTLLAAEYAYRYATSYPGGVFWVFGEGYPTEGLVRLAGDLRVIAHTSIADALAAALETSEGVKALGSDAGTASPHGQHDTSAVKLARAVTLALQNQHKPTLLILDNITSTEWKAFLPAGLVRVLATTRDREFCIGRDLRVGVLSGDKAMELAELISNRIANPTDRTACERVVIGQLGCLPIAVEVAARACQRWRLPWSIYEKQLKDHANSLLDDGRLQREYPRGVFSALDLSIDRCVAGDPARALLESTILFSNDQIPMDWLIDASALEKDSVTVYRALGMLDDLALIRFDTTAQFISIHPLVQRRLKDRLSVERWQEIAISGSESVGKWLHEKIESEEISNVEKLAEVDSRRLHISKVLECSERILPGVAWSLIVKDFVEYLRYRSDFNAAKEWMQRCKLLSEKTEQLGLESASEVAQWQAEVMTWNAEVLLDIDDYASAEELFKQAFELNMNALGEEDPRTLLAASHLGIAENHLGSEKDAYARHRRLLSQQEQRFGVDAPILFNLLNNMAIVCRNMGKLSEAHTHLERAIRIYEQDATLKKDESAFAALITSLALVKQDLGDYVGARPFLEESLKICRSLFPPKHPRVIKALTSLGRLLAEIGDMPIALSLLDEAVRMAEKGLGPDSIILANCYSNLGQAYQKLGSKEETTRLYSLALSMAKFVYGDDHPGLAMYLVNLGSALLDQKKYVDAQPLLQKALEVDESRHGPDHIEVAIDLRALAVLHYGLGNLARARGFINHAVSIVEKNFPDGHPETAGMLHILGSILEEEQKLSEAKDVYSRAMAIAERLLPPGHSYYVALLFSYTHALHTLGRTEDAVRVLEKWIENIDKQLGGQHRHLPIMLVKISTWLGEIGQSDKALLYLTRAAKIVNETDPSQDDNFELRLKLAEAFYKTGQIEMLRSTLTEQLSIGERLFGLKSRRILPVLIKLGGTLAARQDPKGRELLDRALEITVETQDASDSEVAELFYYLGCSYQEEDSKRAHEFFSRAYTVAKKHPRDGEELIMVLERLLQPVAQPDQNDRAIANKGAIPKVGRNAPCPCGSGKKYKKCHG